MLVRIIHDCGAAFVLTSKEFASHKSITELLKSSPVPWHCEVDTEMLPEEASESEATNLLDKVKPEDIPFLQYTSGSTGTRTCMTVYVYGIPLLTHVISAE
jgi:acyl-CoA synthetase (AMP-forming)/AMP-acid ligase II